MDKKVVVTGCSGFIGFHLSNSLLEADKQVIGIDSLNSAYDVKLKQKRLEKLDKNNNFTFFNNNLSQEDSLNEIKKYDISTIYHMAARAGVRQSFLDPQSYIEDNTYATANVANFCKEIEIPEIILASTSSIYGDSGENLMVEEKDEKINSLMRSIDNTNHRYGRSTLSVASAGVHKKWNMRRQYSSKIDTADFYCLPTIRA